MLYNLYVFSNLWRAVIRNEFVPLMFHKFEPQQHENTLCFFIILTQIL